MDLSNAVSATVSTLRRRPGDLLPFYFLGTAVPVIARLGLLASLAGVYLHYELSGRLDVVRDTLADVDLTPPDTEDPAAIEQWAEGLLPAFEPLLTPTAAALLVAGVVVTVVLAALTYAAVSAGQMSAVIARLRSDRGLTAGIAGVRDRWLTFLGLYLAEILLWIGVILLASVAVTVTFVINPFLGAVVALGVFLLGAVLLLAIRIVFAFAPAAIVVDDVGVFGSLDGAGGFIRSNPADAAAYLVVAVGVTVAIASAASGLAFLGGGAVVALVSAVVAAPALDLLKTVLYGDYRGTVSPVDPPAASVRTQFTGGVRRGWREMVAFVVRTPGIHLFVAALGVGSGAVGWILAEPFVGAVPTSIEARLENHIAPVAAVEFFGNNWAVAISTALGGVALVIPALSAIVFNGVVLGGTAALEVNPEALLAFVIPHGVFEIPAIFIAGALGAQLGIVSWRAFRGRVSRAELADTFETAFWVLIGVGILLAIAAVIEGFVSPYYWRPFL